MSDANFPSAELAELVDAVCEDRATDAELARLEALLKSDRAAQQFYLRRMHLLGLLKWELGQAAERDAMQQLKRMRSVAEPATPSVAPAAPIVGPAKSARTSWKSFAVAASLLLAFGLAVINMPRHNTGPLTPQLAVVRYAQSVDAIWATAHVVGTPDSIPQVGDALPPRELHLISGIARFDFQDGASVTLEGPAWFTVVSGQRGILHRGRLTAHAPPQAIGFRIDTPSMAVVDLGTVFGLSADGGAAEVLVFDGEVAVSTTDNQAGSPTKRLIAEGKAARVEAGRDQIGDAQFNAAQFERTWPVSYGVVDATGQVRFVEPAPRIIPRKFEDNDHLVVFPERESIVLDAALPVAVDRPGTYSGPFDPQAGKLAAGTRLRSYLMQFNPVGRNKDDVFEMQGSITFERPILGLICTTTELSHTDKLFTPRDEWRPGRGGGGVEHGDTVTLSPDRRTLHVRLTAAAANDQIRVLVEVPAPFDALAGR